MIEIDRLPIGSHRGLDKFISKRVSQGELRHEEGAQLLPGRAGEIVVKRRHMDQQCGCRDPVIVGIEMAGMFASTAQFGEQMSDFFKHGSPTQSARDLKLAWSLTYRRPYGRACPPLTSGLAKTYWTDLRLRRFHRAKRCCFQRGGLPGGFARAAARTNFPRKMKE